MPAGRCNDKLDTCISVRSVVARFTLVAVAANPSFVGPGVESNLTVDTTSQ